MSSASSDKTSGCRRAAGELSRRGGYRAGRANGYESQAGADGTVAGRSTNSLVTLVMLDIITRGAGDVVAHYIDNNSAVAIQVCTKNTKTKYGWRILSGEFHVFLHGSGSIVLTLDPVSSASPAVEAAGLDVGAREVSAAFAFDDAFGACIGLGDLKEGEAG